MADPTLEAALDAVGRTRPRCGPVRVVAIDGGAAAGKTSLATELARRLPGTSILHTDDLVDGWSGQFTFWPRLRAEVLEPLAAGRPGRYRRFDWTAGHFDGWVAVPVPRILIVEGVSAIDACGVWLSLGLFLDVPRQVRARRWAERDGAALPQWRTWLDNEDAYFAAGNPSSSAVLRLQASVPSPPPNVPPPPASVGRGDAAPATEGVDPRGERAQAECGGTETE